MRKLLFFCLGFLPLIISAQADNERSLRDSFVLKMPVTEDSYYQSPIPASPFIVGPKILQLFPGESILLEVEEKDGAVINIKVVKENKHPDRTLEISFSQIVEKNKHAMMMLKVKNPFKRSITYNAVIRLMKSENWVKTSIKPVAAGLFGMEMWPDPIISIALNEWKFVQ